MKQLLVVACIYLVSLSVLASGHPMTKIIGTNIDLSMLEHSFAGKIGDKIVYGRIHGNSHKYVDLTIDDGHKVLTTRMENTEGLFGGVIEGDAKTTLVEFKNIIRNDKENAIVILVNNVEYKVSIKADGFENGHFINPKFSTVIDSKEVNFKIAKGESCWMNSIQLVLSVVGTYMH